MLSFWLDVNEVIAIGEGDNNDLDDRVCKTVSKYTYQMICLANGNGIEKCVPEEIGPSHWMSKDVNVVNGISSIHS